MIDAGCGGRRIPVAVVELLLERDAPIRALLTRVAGPRCDLIYAAKGSHLPVVDRLLERGSDPNAARKDGGTALMKAAQGGHLPVVDRLLEPGVDPNVAKKSRMAGPR
jgi:ankyrin repeat protein